MSTLLRNENAATGRPFGQFVLSMSCFKIPCPLLKASGSC